MSSFDKVVKLACKPKAAPPKAKYLDPIIAATWSEDGAVHDVCKALSPRFREPNAIIVFKALIVLHTMIRNGATDNVLSYLSSGEILRLRNVSAGQWDGYTAPENLQSYAVYLDCRIRAYHELKHDAIRVQAENNRDMRNLNATDDDMYTSMSSKRKAPAPPPAVSRSKTLMGRKLRSMTVEKGLLRETKVVHKMIDTLVECRFYLDDLDDELTTTALRMLVKDLLILFQAGNEGIINVLEHYFEMSHVDAKDALAIYRNFCKQTERVVEYLGVAKKLQNLLNVPIPNLKHAPVSLAGALQEYLEDPNFEQNRREYRENKDAADGKKPNGKAKPAEPVPPLPTATKPAEPAASLSPNTTAPPARNSTTSDFFDSIEDVQPTMFNPATNSPSTAYFQQQGSVNPFQMRMSMYAQATGVQMPQQTGFPAAPFGMQGQASHLRPQPTGGHRPFSSFIPQQMTGMAPQQTNGFLGPPQQGGFLQPQTTGSNPFRQSMLMPQTTGMQTFGGMGGMGGGFASAPASQHSSPLARSSFGDVGMPQQQQQQPTGAAFGAFAPTASASFGGAPSTNTNAQNAPARPSSTPLTAFGSSPSNTTNGPPMAQPVKTHQTGTRNPFGRPASPPPPPMPKQPTLMELAMGMGQQNGNNNQSMSPPPQNNQQQQLQGPQQTGSTNGFSYNSSALNPGSTNMSGVASSFTFSGQANKPTSPGSQTGTDSTGQLSSPPSFSFSSFNNPTPTGSTVSDSLFSSSGPSLSSHTTGMTATTGTSSPPPGQHSSLKSHMTGMSGLKPFKPSSSFGASLLESLPPIPGSSPNTPAVTGGGGSNGFPGISEPQNQSQQTNGSTSPLSSGAFSSGGFGSQPTGYGGGMASPPPGGQPQQRSLLGTGLRPQMTGGGANPFRASMLSQQSAGSPTFGPGGGFQGSQGQPAFGQQGMGGGNTNSMFAGSASPNMGGNFGAFGSQPQQGQQQTGQVGGSSLI